MAARQNHTNDQNPQEEASRHPFRILLRPWVLFLVVLAAVLGFAFSTGFNQEIIMHTGHIFEMTAIASVFALILLPNIIRMWNYIILKPGIKVSIKTYTAAMGDLLVHMFTQKRTLGCDDSTRRWFEHLLLVAGYLTLLFTTVFLNWFESSNIVVIALGYLVSAVVFIVTIDFVTGRIRKKKEISRFSQPSDWLFVIWLCLLGLTAFAVRLSMDLGMAGKVALVAGSSRGIGLATAVSARRACSS